MPDSLPPPLLSATQENLDLVKHLLRFPVYIELHDQRHHTQLHHQPGIEINLTNQGRGTFLIGKHAIPLAPRQVLIFSGEQLHQLRADPTAQYTRTVICMDPKRASLTGGMDAIRQILDGAIHNIRLDPADYIQAERWMCRLNLELLGRPHGWEAMAAAVAWRFLLTALREIRPASDVHPAEGASVSELVQEVAAHVQVHLNDNLDLRETAHSFKVSPEHLTRSFARETGLSFHRFVLSQRISKAQNLLRDRPDLSLIDIALMTGFQSASNFSRTFRSAKQMSPSEYRKSVGSV